MSNGQGYTFAAVADTTIQGHLLCWSDSSSCHQTHSHLLPSGWLSGHKFSRTLFRSRELWPAQTIDLGLALALVSDTTGNQPSHTHVTPAAGS